MMTHIHHEDVKVLHLPPQPTLSIRETVPLLALGEARGRMLRVLADVLTRRGIRPVGSPVVRYHTFNEVETDLELAVPFNEPQAGEDPVVSGELPGGPVATTWHLGPHDTLGNTYTRLKAWCQAQSREPGGTAWEIYTWIDLLTSADPGGRPAPSTWWTQLVQPLTHR
ncbi:hypothetical protein E7T06_16155 [Deinococcus sp. Arct2-2]|uniref:GyrI-like domain-containing protein n=1 Tax=Deinococcus sp. Arct2-2 TaxID=2568653 RepID=UPI0010A3D256|nr:GyrI-like domain-containing protein [Deinococcus sp. Arct2-2]THF68546.1 hypothetical protein E7T06_16155 [Deinococcus sp. Arct2-2]